MRILPTFVGVISCATISAGAESLFNRIQLIMRSTFHKFGCSQASQRAVSHSIAGVAMGIAVTAIAYKAITIIRASFAQKARKYFCQALDRYDSKDYKGALEDLEKALQIFKGLCEEKCRHVAKCHKEMTFAYKKLEKYEEALKNLKKALPYFERLHTDYKEILDWQNHINQAQNNVQSTSR